MRVEGNIIGRVNRFTVEVEVGGERKKAFLPNSGRLKELITPGTPAILITKEKGLPFRLVAVKKKVWVSVDSHLVNAFFARGIEKGEFPPFRNFKIKKREFKRGGRRLDFLLTNGKQEMLVELKSCTLVQKGYGMFPDAPTERGREHLEELMEWRKTVGRAAVIFVIQRKDGKSFIPNSATHPEFARTLYKSLLAGVEGYYILTSFDPEKLSLQFRAMKKIDPEKMALEEFAFFKGLPFPWKNSMVNNKELREFLIERGLDFDKIKISGVRK